MRMTTITALGAALTLGALAVVLTRGLLQNAGGPKTVRGTIVVAAQPLPFGTVLGPDNLVEMAWPADAVPEGAFATRTELLEGGRRVALAPLHKNEPILVSKVTGPNQRASLSTLIEDGMRAVSVRVDEVRGVAGFVLPNDRVDVVVTRGEGGSGSGPAFADVLLQNVRVLAVDQQAGDNRDKPTVARAVTLELAPAQAQKIILAQGVGRLSLVLRQPGEVRAAEVRRVTTADLGLGDVVVTPEPFSKEEDRTSRETAPLPDNVLPFRRETVVGVVRGGAKPEHYVVRPEGDGRGEVVPLPVVRPAGGSSVPQAVLSGSAGRTGEF
jgi:pilus assembly protein CpaB